MAAEDGCEMMDKKMTAHKSAYNGQTYDFGGTGCARFLPMLKANALAAALLYVLLFVACSTTLADSASTLAVSAPPTSIHLTVPETVQGTATTGAITATTGAERSAFPIRAIFYYPWFPEGWTQPALTPYTHYTPTTGFYHSTNREVIQQHILAMQYGRIDTGIASWWGQGHPTDQRIPALLAAAAGGAFRWALHYEVEGQGDPAVAAIAGDLQYIQTQYGIHPNYLHLDGRMVLFVFADTANREDGCEMVEHWQQANEGNAFLVMKVFRNFRDCPAQPDGWYQYAPGNAESWQRGYSFSISPGFWAADAEQPRLVRNLAQWRQNIRAMVASNEPFQLITSFNEWGEGIAIEAATAWESESGFGLYLDALHNNGAADDSDPAAPGSTPWPTSMPTPPPSAVITLTAVADTYVSQANPTTDYGSASVLRTDVTPTIHSYLRFDLPLLPHSLHRARLHLLANNRSTLGFEVRTLITTTWDESTLTFGNAPHPGYVLGSSGVVEAARWSTVDVTNGIRNTGMQTGSVSFVLANLNNSALSYASRETATPPTLVLELGATTMPPTTEVTVAYAVGDIADCISEGDDATAALLDPLAGAILTLGDTVYMSGTVQQFAECFDPVWGRHKERIRPAVGNHEYITPDAAPYYAYFGSAAGEPTKGYYSYELGAWHVVVLNSNCSEVDGCHASSPQDQWLRADLAAQPSRCTLAYMHHPLWTSGQDGITERLQPLVETLYDYGVDLLLAGHSHQYERYALQDPNGNLDLTHGIRQIIVGTGGKNFEPIIKVLPNSQVREAETFGVLKLLFASDRYSWEFLPVPGRVFTDRGSDICRYIGNRKHGCVESGPLPLSHQSGCFAHRNSR
jgi:acid phosphatase type 7